MDKKLPPYRTFLASDSEIRELLRDHRTIAVCGARAGSSDEVARALQTTRELGQRGYRVLLIGADAADAEHSPVANGLEEVDEPIGIVLVFPGAQELRALVETAAASGAGVIWFEVGVDAPHTAHRANRLGMTAVLGRSIIGEYEMHFPDDELGIDEA